MIPKWLELNVSQAQMSFKCQENWWVELRVLSVHSIWVKLRFEFTAYELTVKAILTSKWHHQRKCSQLLP